MGNFLTACCQPSGRKGKDNLSVSISSGDCPDPIKDIKGNGPPDHKAVNLLATVAQLDNVSSSSEEELETVDKDDVTKESDDDDDTTSEEEATEEQKNKDESSVMVGNGSFSPADHEASDKDSEEVNEPVTQIEMETSRDILEDTAVV